MIRKYSIALALVCALLFSATSRAQELSQADKDKALAYLESTKKDVLDAVKDLSPAQWNFKAHPTAGPSPNAWNTSLPPKTTSAA